jgi:hypothetical protein
VGLHVLGKGWYLHGKQVCLGKVKAFDGFKQVSGVTNLELLIEMKWSEGF